MADVTMSHEAASAELERIESDLESQIPADSRETVIRALRSGRLEWDSAEQQFLYRLKRAVELDNGDRIEVLELTEPTTLQLKKAQQMKNEFEMTARLISYMAGQPAGYIDRLGMRDLQVLGVIVGFFS